MMHQNDECEITLSRLPSDIIRHILGERLETIENKRLISPHWNNVCLAIIRECRPAIKSLCWSKGVSNKGTTFPWLRINLPFRYLNYFGLGQWKILYHSSDTEVRVSSERILEDFLHTSAGTARFTRFFEKCSTIDRLEFKNEIVRINTQMCLIKETLSTARINEVAFTDLPNFNPNTVSQILNMLGKITFQRLVLTIGIGDLHHTLNVLIQNTQFLTTATSLVQEVDISHPFFYRIAYVEYWRCLRETISQNKTVTAEFIEDRVDNTEHFRILVTARVPQN